jgi:hypothetical protein
VGEYDVQWWKAPASSIHEHIFPIIKVIQQNQQMAFDDYVDFARIYGNVDMVGMGPNSYSRTNPDFTHTKRITYNVVKSCIDTVAAKISKNKPRPQFLTDGGDYSLQQKAKKLTKFCEGAFYGVKAYELGKRAFLDGCVFGSGLTKVYSEYGKIKAERVMPVEIFVDDADAVYGEPRQMHQVKNVTKEVLAELYPNKKDKILNLKQDVDWSGGSRALVDHIAVIESWHLPSGPDAKDGKHVISIANTTLLSEPWKRDRFPFACYKWSDRIVGWRGQGLCEELIGIQVEINRILKTISQIVRLVVPKLLVEKGSKVVLAHMNNEIGGILEYSGTKPSYEWLQAIPPDLFNQLDRLYQKAFEIAGVSQLSAQALKPAGLDAAVALREYNDIETERFILKGQAYENYYLDFAALCIDEAKTIADQNKGHFEVSLPTKKGRETIDWKDVDLEEDQYVMQMFPTSSLSKTPSARLQQVQEMLQAGFISKDDGLKLLDFPDLESVMSLTNAAAEDIDMMIEEMLEKGKPMAPEPYQNLQLGIMKCQSAYLRGKMNKVPPENLELLQRWIKQASANLIASQPPAPTPIAVPEKPPVSPMLPVKTVEPAVQ